MKNKILVIIPAYNEEESIEKVVSNLENDFSFYDYVVINDGSKDATSEICHKNGFNIIDLPENLGLTGAVQTGFKYALKNGYENYFSLKFPEYANQNEDEKSGAREKIFSNYVIGNPVSRENIIIALVRFYKSESFMDVQMYIENNDDFKLSQIRILQWQK